MPLVIAVAPDKLAGFASPRPINPQALHFLPPQLAALPNLGGGSEANLEKLNTAIAFGSTRQLRQLGIVVDAEKAYKELGNSMFKLPEIPDSGKVDEELTSGAGNKKKSKKGDTEKNKN